MTFVPKVDLHVHAETDPRIDRILARQRRETPYDWQKWIREVSLIPPGIERLNAMHRCRPPEQVRILDADAELFVERIYDLMVEEAVCGCVLSEVLFGAQTIMRNDFLTGFRKAEQRVQTGYPYYNAEPLVCFRHTSEKQLWMRAIELATEGLAGINIIPDPYETEAEWTAVYLWAEQAAAAGLGITAHAGEFSTANIRSALNVPGLTRIGHLAYTSKGLVEMIAKRHVAVECCLTCNIVLGAARSLESHPIRRFYEHGIVVALGTDDPVRVCTTIEQEYHTAARLGFTPEDLLEFTMNGIRYSFAPKHRKDRIERIVTTDIERSCCKLSR